MVFGSTLDGLVTRNTAGSGIAHGRPDIVSHWGPLSWPAVRALKSPRRPWSGEYNGPHDPPFAETSSPSYAACASRFAFSSAIHPFPPVNG